MAPTRDGFPSIRDRYQIHPDFDIGVTGIGYLNIRDSKLFLDESLMGDMKNIDSTLNSLMVQITKKMLNG